MLRPWLLSRACCDHATPFTNAFNSIIRITDHHTTNRFQSSSTCPAQDQTRHMDHLSFSTMSYRHLGKASHAIDLFTRCWSRLISITDSVERDEDGSGKDSLCLSRKIFQLSFLNTVELNATEQAKRLSLPSDKLCNERYLCGDPHSHRYSAWNCVSIVSLRCDKHVGISHYVHGKSNKSNFGGRIMRMFIGKHVGQSLAMFDENRVAVAERCSRARDLI
jgi:hypothetical protein